MDGDLLPRRAGLTPEKITREHQQRLAIIYIRQSTPQQVERNQESTKLQYALVDRAFYFGWARETIVTIDDDLGRWRKLASAMSVWFWASRCRGWRDLAGTGINCWRYARCSTR